MEDETETEREDELIDGEDQFAEDELIDCEDNSEEESREGGGFGVEIGTTIGDFSLIPSCRLLSSQVESFFV